MWTVELGHLGHDDAAVGQVRQAQTQQVLIRQQHEGAAVHVLRLHSPRPSSSSSSSSSSHGRAHGVGLRAHGCVAAASTCILATCLPSPTDTIHSLHSNLHKHTTHNSPLGLGLGACVSARRV
jgi:hypothetical protein